MFLLPFFIIFSSFAKASNNLHISIGTDLFQAHYKEQRIEIDKWSAFQNPHKNISRVSVGLSYKPFNDYYFYITGRTNRLINAPTENKGYDVVANQSVNVFQKLIADSLIFSTALHKNFMPFVVITKSQAQTLVVYNNGVSSNTKVNATLYGGGFAIPFAEKHSIAFTYFLGNKNFNTKRAVGVSYNYLIL